MLALFRRFAKTWVAALLMGLLVISFAVFGINDVFTGTSGNWIVQAGDRKLESGDFKRFFDNIRKDQEQRSGQTITPDMAVKQGMDIQILNEVASQESLAALFTKWGLVPSDNLIAKRLGQQTAFFDAFSGKFDKATYERRLGEEGLTPTRFEAFLRDEIAGTHFSAAAVNGLRVPRIYTATNAVFGLERRGVTVLALDPGRVGAPPEPTEAELKAFMSENAARLKLPESRILSFVRFTATDYEPSMVLDPDKVRKAFEFKKDSLSKPETRSLIQIPIKTDAQATDLVQRLNRGEDPRAVARALKIEPVVYDNQPRTAIVDKRVSDAAFQATSGSVIGPVNGELGRSVIKVLSVTPAQAVTFEQVQAQLEAEVRKQMATEQVYKLSTVFDEAHAAGSNLTEAAQKAGVPVLTLGPLTAQGQDRTGQPIQALPPALLKRAFEMSTGEDTGIEEAGPGDYYAVRVDRILPAAVPPLDEIRPQLVRAMMQQRMAARLKAAAETAAERWRKGETPEALAAALGGRVAKLDNLDRAGANERVQALGEPLLIAALSGKPGQVVVAPLPNGIFVAAKIDRIGSGDPPDVARFTESQRPEATMQVFQELGSTARSRAISVLKTRSSLSRARLAIGLDPDEVKKLEAVPDAAGKSPK